MEGCEELGKGRFGVVRKVKVGGLICAAKHIIMSNLNKSGRKSVERELSILKKVSHANIIRFYGEERLDCGGQLVFYSELFQCSLKLVISCINESKRLPFTLNEIWCDSSSSSFNSKLSRSLSLPLVCWYF